MLKRNIEGDMMKKKFTGNKFTDKIKEFSQSSQGISVRRLSFKDTDIYLLYIPQLTDRERLSTDIIRPILHYYEGNEPISSDVIASSVICLDDISVDNDENKILNYILSGKSVILISNDAQYIIANTLKIEKRSTQPPDLETTLRGSKDAFTENFDANLSLLRYRLKDPALSVEKFTVGKRTKTNVAVIYISDIANQKYVNDVKNRLKNISIDGIVDSGYVQKFIMNSASDLFPQVGIVERSDTACDNILEGKVCIIVEGNNLALVAPKTFVEFFDTGEDHYSNIYLAVFSKIIRYISLFLTLTLSSLYVAVVAFHSDILPAQYILAIAISRATVPFNALFEATLMELTSEILREASIRLPKQIGPAIGIVGTIVIGQAAVGAGLVSPLMVIIVSLSTMCSFVAPDYTIMSPIRLLKFFMIFITGIFGIFGFTMGFTVITIYLVSLTSFGVPYLTPVAPFNFKDLKNYILSDITLAKKRPNFLRTQDNTRQKK